MQCDFLSVTKIRTYEDCPRKYHYVYEKGLKASADHLTFGVIIHETLEDWFKDSFSTPILDIYDRHWKKHGLTGFDYYNEGVNMLKSFVGNPQNYSNSVLTIDGEMMLEKKFELKTPNGTPIVGVIDRVDKISDKAIEIIDYKTSFLPHTRDEMENDIQLTIYDWAAREMFPEFEDVKLSLYFLRHEKLSTQRSSSVRSNVSRYLDNIYEQIINDNEAKPKINRYCNWCPGKHLCEAYLSLTKDEKLQHGILDMEDNEDEWSQCENIKAKVKVLEGRRKELESNLLEKMKQEGRGSLVVGDKEIFPSLRKTSIYDFETVKAVLGEDKLPSVVSIRKESVDAIATPQQKEKLEATASYTYSKPYLRARKVKKDNNKRKR